MIEYNLQDALNRLYHRPNIVRTTVKTLSLGFVLIIGANAAYTAYTEARQHRFFSRAATFIEKSDTFMNRFTTPSIDSLVHETRLLQQELSETKETLQQIQFVYTPPQSISINSQPQVPAPQQNTSLIAQSPAKPCGTTRSDDRNGYIATRDNCILLVTMPYGGSISGASLTYFNDMHRWRSDWRRRENEHIRNADLVEPGQTYTFTLP